MFRKMRAARKARRNRKMLAQTKKASIGGAILTGLANGAN